MSARTVQITKEQAAAIQELGAGVELARERLNLAFSLVLRGHGIVEASNPSLTGTTLTVQVTDEAG